MSPTRHRRPRRPADDRVPVVPVAARPRTARYASVDLMKACHEASGCEIVTLPVRRAEPDPARPSLLDAIDPKRYFVLATTAGSATSEEAVAAPGGGGSSAWRRG